MFGLVWLRFGLAKFGLAIFGSQIDGIGHTDAACKISAQSDLIWLSYSFPYMGTALDRYREIYRERNAIIVNNPQPQQNRP